MTNKIPDYIEKEYLEPKERDYSGLVCRVCGEYIPAYGEYYDLDGYIVCADCVKSSHKYAERMWD